MRIATGEDEEDSGKGPPSGCATLQERKFKLRHYRRMTASCFEISIDGKPWTYRDTKEAADAAVATLRTKYPNSHVLVRDLRARSGLTLVPPSDA
jgi:hypothetical protein